MKSTPSAEAVDERNSRTSSARTLQLSHIGDGTFVHLIEHRLILLLDDLALHLQRRCELALVDRQIGRQDRELFDALVLREALVDLLEIRIEQALGVLGTNDL